MRFARKEPVIAAVAALVVLLSGCGADVSADTVMSGRIVPMATSIPLDGKFVVEDGCVHVQMQEDGETHPVIWPGGSEISGQDSSRVALLNDSVSLKQKPKDFEVAFVDVESLAGKVQRGEIDGWDECMSNGEGAVLVITTAGDIMLPQ
jgi:hypothetical protein